MSEMPAQHFPNKEHRYRLLGHGEADVTGEIWPNGQIAVRVREKV